MDTSIDHYAALGVSKTATRAEIKAAWSQLVQRFHPDMGDEADPTRFMEVQRAFDVLGDESKRREYDSARSAAVAGADSVEPGWGEAAPSQPAPKVNREGWVPPHLRPDPEPAPAPTAPRKPQPAPEQTSRRAAAPPKPQQKAAASPQVQRPKAHDSWRIEVNPEQKLTLTRGWRSLWLPPLVSGGVGLLAALQTIRVGGEGVQGTVATALVALVVLATIAGIIADGSRAPAGKGATAGTMFSCVAGMIAVVAGFIMSNYWLLATAVFLCMSGILTVMSLHYKYVTARQMPAPQLRKYAAYGKPGKQAPNSVLQIVEQDLADKLNELFSIASVRLFHGLGVPATTSEQRQGASVTTRYGAPILNGGHVGHAVTAGKKVALLNSVVWPAGHYTVDQYGGVCIDGQHTQYEVEPFVEIFKHWKNRLRGVADTRLIVVVHSDGPVSFDMPSTEVEFVTADHVVDTLGPWLVGEQGTADRHVNAVMAEHLAAA